MVRTRDDSLRNCVVRCLFLASVIGGVGLLCIGCDDCECVCPEAEAPPVLFPQVTVVPDSVAAELLVDVDPRGLQTFCDCLYGTSVDSMLVSQATDAGAGMGVTQVTLSLDDLRPLTSYLFRLRASSAAGTTCGRVDSFATLRRNERPETVIALTSVTYIPGGQSTVRLNWYAWDSDGEIVGYELLNTVDGVSSDWFTALTTDSVFLFGPEVQERWQMDIRAVDNDGGIDLTPATWAFDIPDTQDVVMHGQVTEAVGSPD